MALPDKVRVKLSSESAEAISLTPVVVQELPLRELIEHVLGVTGKDEARIREILHRGSLVAGASRFRWVGWEIETEALRLLLAGLPDADPSRAFARDSWVRAVLSGGRHTIEIPRAAAARKGLFRRASFWDLLMELASGADLDYGGYSYRDRADWYKRDVTLEEAGRLREASSMVRYITLQNQLRSIPVTDIELFTLR